MEWIAQAHHSTAMPDHPPYALMITKAIESLGGSGSTEPAIAHFISSNYPGVSRWHEKLLHHYLGKHTKEGLFVLVAPGKYSLPIYGCNRVNRDAFGRPGRRHKTNLYPQLIPGSARCSKQSGLSESMRLSSDSDVEALLVEPLQVSNSSVCNYRSTELVNLEACSISDYDGRQICYDMLELTVPNSGTDMSSSTSGNDGKQGDEGNLQLALTEPFPKLLSPKSTKCVEDHTTLQCGSSARVKDSDKFNHTVCKSDMCMSLPMMRESKVIKVFCRRRQFTESKTCSPGNSRILKVSGSNANHADGSKSESNNGNTLATLYYGRGYQRKRKRFEIPIFETGKYSLSGGTDSCRDKAFPEVDPKLIGEEVAGLSDDNHTMICKIACTGMPLEPLRRGDNCAVMHIKTLEVSRASAQGNKRGVVNKLEHANEGPDSDNSSPPLEVRKRNRRKYNQENSHPVLQRCSPMSTAELMNSGVGGSRANEDIQEPFDDNILIASLYHGSSLCRKQRRTRDISAQAAKFLLHESVANNSDKLTAVLALPASQLMLRMKNVNDCQSPTVMQSGFEGCALALPAFTRVP